MISFPGYDNDGSLLEFKTWNNEVGDKVAWTIEDFWIVINLLSTIIVLLSILKIFKMVNEVRFTNPNLKFNTKAILMHVLLMIV
jgi:hypothetical protein